MIEQLEKDAETSSAQAAFDQIRKPTGVGYVWSGDMENQCEGFGSMGIALLAAIVLVYLILVALYNSFVYPFVVLFSIPLSIVGALLALALTNNSLNLFTMANRSKLMQRLMLTDSQGNLLSVLVFAAHRHDGATALHWWEQTLMDAPFLAEVDTITGDQHFSGRFKRGVENSSTVQVVAALDPVTRTKQPQIIIYKKRWVVERTIAWETTSRRLARDYERKPLHAEAFCLISSIVRMIKNPVALN